MQDTTTSADATILSELEASMTDKPPKDTPTREPGPNNPEEAVQFVKATNTALMKFVDRIHSFDRYKSESAYEYYVHDILNELLKMDQPYYKHTTIQPVLDTIFDKYCKFLLKPDDKDIQLSQQWSPDDIEQADKVIHQLATIEDMDTLSDKAIANLHGMFAQLQLCHENSPKLAGHFVQLSTSLTPNQYTYVMKHSLHPSFNYHYHPGYAVQQI